MLTNTDHGGRSDGTELWSPVWLDGKLADICLIRIIAYSG